MRFPRRIALAAPALLLALLSTSCGLLVKSRVIRRHQTAVTKGQAQVLLSATKEELNERIRKIYDPVRSFQVTVDMTPSIGSVYQGQISEVKDVRAYVLFRKTSDIRIIGLAPVVRSRAFDMVSNGDRFRLFLSTKNLFVEGDNKAPATSKNKLENLRPEAFLSSMLIQPKAADELPILTDQTDEDDAVYVLLFVRQNAAGELVPSRSIWFDRLDLNIIRQLTYDAKGDLTSDTRYAKWKMFDNVYFPSHIDINRPEDGYGVAMDVMQMQMNKTFTDNDFVLTRPEGSQLQTIGASQPAATPATNSPR